ncbi:MAG: non-canonical purine NTP pyrophosphatase, partial [Bacilli bacterium]|nr:non-canonical purine NTP pyrophosphatase [Bacilli bacterium]
MTKKVILCTKNKGKVKEFEELFNSYNIDIKIISLFDLDDNDEVEENGESFKENA